VASTKFCIRQVSSHFFGQSSFGSYANVAESSLIPVPKSAPLEVLAPLGCGDLWGQGRFPFDKLIRNYKLEDINLAFGDSASGATVKPVVVY
jgi:Zn-dependent alcohol dehydrogenase